MPPPPVPTIRDYSFDDDVIYIPCSALLIFTLFTYLFGFHDDLVNMPFGLTSFWVLCGICFEPLFVCQQTNFDMHLCFLGSLAVNIQLTACIASHEKKLLRFCFLFCLIATCSTDSLLFPIAAGVWEWRSLVLKQHQQRSKYLMEK